MSLRDNTLTQRPQSAEKPSSFNYGWIIVIVCLVIAFISFAIRFSFGNFFKPIEADFGLSRAATSGVQSIFQLLGCVVAPIGGIMLDRYGPKKVFAAVGTVTAVALILTSRATALWQLYLSYSILAAVGTGAVNSMVSATVSRWFVKKRALAVGIVLSSVSLAMISTPVISILISSYKWQGAYLIIGLVALGLWIPVAFLLKRNPNSTFSSTDAPAPSKSQTWGMSLTQAMKTRPFWLLFFVWFTQSFAMMIIMTHLIPYAQDLNIDPAKAASILSVTGVVSLVARLIMGPVADAGNKRLIALIFIGIICVSMLWLVWANTLWTLYIFAAIYGIGIGGLGPVSVAVFSELFGTRHLGAILGAIDTSYGIGSAIGPTVAGFIFDLNKSYMLAFVAGFIMMMISLGLFWAVKWPDQKAKAEVSKVTG